MSLSPSDSRKIKDAFNECAAGPYGRMPAAKIGGHVLTVSDLAKEIETETPVGKALLNMFDMAISSGQVTVDQVVETIKHPPAPPRM
jgi:hypothetical protein